MEINKNSPETETCYNKEYNNFIEGINYQTNDTLFFSYIIQFMLISLMYYYVGKGKYWKVLYYASIAGLLGAILEHSTLAVICQKNKKKQNGRVYIFLIEEFLWIVCEYSIPIINLIKMESLTTGKKFKIIKLLIAILFVPYSIVRIFNGYDRMMKGYLNTRYSKYCLSIAYSALSIADIICTISIIHLAKIKGKKGRLNTTFISLIKNSSYTVLVAVDIVNLILSFLYIINTLIPGNTILRSFTSLFHCFKSVFLLILSTDALIFKYEYNYYNSESVFQSEDNCSFNNDRTPVNNYSGEIITSSNLHNNKEWNKKYYSMSRMPDNTNYHVKSKENSYLYNIKSINNVNSNGNINSINNMTSTNILATATPAIATVGKDNSIRILSDNDINNITNNKSTNTIYNSIENDDNENEEDEENIEE